MRRTRETPGFDAYKPFGSRQNYGRTPAHQFRPLPLQFDAEAITRRSIATSFFSRSISLRKARRLTQQALADLVGMHISQIRRYESGQSQPTLDAIRKLSVALSVSADMLLFEKDERGPDDDLKLQFEAVSRLNDEEKHVIRSVIESMLVRNTVKEAERRWSAAAQAASTRG